MIVAAVLYPASVNKCERMTSNEMMQSNMVSIHGMQKAMVRLHV